MNLTTRFASRFFCERDQQRAKLVRASSARLPAPRSQNSRPALQLRRTRRRGHSASRPRDGLGPPSAFQARRPRAQNFCFPVVLCPYGYLRRTSVHYLWEKSDNMLLHIALVSIARDVTLAHLAPVSAAIQKQISRDFGPMWNVQATVDAFDKLEDVPIGYWHVLLQDELPNGAAGLHKRDDNKQPFALVALTTHWPVFMSHEVLEMLADPQGTL